MKWFREGPSPYQTPLAMIGARPADRVLMLGADDAKLAAEVALVTGLNGHTLVVDPSPTAHARLETAAAAAGTLISFEPAPVTMLPLDPGAFDIVVISSHLGVLAEHDRRLVCDEAHRVLRAGGRVVVIERGTRPGLIGRLTRQTASESVPSGQILELLKGAGFRAVRVLADSDGSTYFEGRRSA